MNKKVLWYNVSFLFWPLLLVIGIITNNKESSIRENLNQITGKITESSVVYSAPVFRGDRSQWWTNVKYYYTVNGKPFENNKISMADCFYEKKAEAESVVNLYTIGKTVPVFYFPGDPQTAYLVNDDFGYGAVICMLSLLGIIICTPIIWYLKRLALKRNEILS